MLSTTRAVVLRTIRHGDRTVVLKAYTQQFGARSYMVRVGGKGGVAPSAVQPLSLVEAVVTEHAEREMHAMRELRVYRPFNNLSSDPIRGALALFAQELFVKVLREESTDPGLYAFIENALEAMDNAPDVRCYPLVLLLQLSGHLGFYPEHPATGDERFDLQEGHFIGGGVPHGHTLDARLSKVLAGLLDVDFNNMADHTVPSAQRRQLLDHLLHYYRIHVPGMGEMRSPQVLHQVLT